MTRLEESEIYSMMEELDKIILAKHVLIERVDGLLRLKNTIDEIKNVLSFLPFELENIEDELYEDIDDYKFINDKLDKSVSRIYDKLEKIQ